MGKLAEAYVEIGSRTKGFDDGIASSQAKLKDFVGATNSLLGLAGVGLGAGGIVAFLKSAADAGSNLGETMSKTQQVFGSATGSITRFADDMADKFGAVKQITLDAASSIGLVAQASGMTESASAKLAIQLTRLADDASSFYNVPLAEALQKIRSGLVGESEPLRAFGVLLSESAVTAKAQEMGLTGLHGELTEGQKVMARSQIIIEQLNKASGDHERTLGSYANQVRLLTGEFENMKAAIGAPIAGGLAATMEVLRKEGVGGYIRRAMPIFGAGFDDLTNRNAGVNVGLGGPPGPIKPEFVGPPMRPPGLQPSEVFGGGGFGAFGMMGTLGLKMAQQGAINDVDKAIDQASKSRFQGNLGSQSVDSFLASAQATVLDDSNKQQLDELKAIKETLIAIRDGQAKPGPQMQQGTFLKGRE